MDPARDTGGVVSWDSNVDFTFGLSDDFTHGSGLKFWIDQVDSSGGTILNVGLHEAIDMLDANTRTEASVEVIIFLTDGQGYYTYSGLPGSPADEAASKGYVIYSIGLGSPSSAPLEDMATTTGGDYYAAATAENLAAIYNAIYEEVTTSTVPHYVDVIEVTRSYIVGHHNFNIAPDSITPNVDGTTTLVWENVGMYADGDPDLSADETVVLTCDVWSTKVGMGLKVEVYGQAKVTYRDKDNNAVGAVPIPQATINIHPYITDLIAGGGNPKSTIDVGDIIAWNDGDWLYVKYVTTNGWYMSETHLHVATSVDKIPQTKKNNPIPGQFTNSTVHSPTVQEFEYKIPWTYDPGTTLYIAAHAVVEKVVGYTECTPIYQEETAWGKGLTFNDKNWAMYFVYEDP